jgi:rRNA-processing protein CGR1
MYINQSPLAPHVSRSHARPALKSKSFDDRMEKATKAQAIKKLQAELKEEKQAEIRR